MRKYKIEDIIDIECKGYENRKMLNEALMQIKPVSKLVKKNKETGEFISVDTLERAMHGLLSHYKYNTQGINSYYEDGEFVFYTASILRIRETREWIGTVNGATLWEVVAKIIIKVYLDIVSTREKGEQYVSK